MVNVSDTGTETSLTYRTDLQDLRPIDCCGSSEEGEDSEEDTGEDTSVDEFSDDDDDDKDSEGDADSGPFSADTSMGKQSHAYSYKLFLAQTLLPPFSSNLMFCFETYH